MSSAQDQAARSSVLATERIGALSVVLLIVRSMIIETRRTSGNGYEIKPGARIPYPTTRLHQLSLDVTTVCDQMNPDRWHAEVSLLGERLVTTSQFDTDDKAARAAEKSFKEKVGALFRE